MDESSTRGLMSARADCRAVPGLSRALRTSADRPSQVIGLLRTLATWYLSRSNEARRLSAECGSYASKFCRLQHERETLREASVGQANALERSNSERDRQSRESDELRALRSAPQPAPRHVMHDPYDDRGYQPHLTRGVALVIGRRDGDAYPRGFKGGSALTPQLLSFEPLRIGSVVFSERPRAVIVPL